MNNNLNILLNLYCKNLIIKLLSYIYNYILLKFNIISDYLYEQLYHKLYLYSFENTRRFEIYIW